MLEMFFAVNQLDAFVASHVSRVLLVVHVVPVLGSSEAFERRSVALRVVGRARRRIVGRRSLDEIHVGAVGVGHVGELAG